MLHKYLIVLVTAAFWSIIFISYFWQTTNLKLYLMHSVSFSELAQSGTPSQSLEKPLPVPLLTLFTTFKESPERVWIQTNVILNWELLYPQVQPLLFSTNISSLLSQTAQKHHWIVLPVPAVSSYGTPFFKEMYYAAYNYTKSHFYAYSNADILFTQSLIDTVTAVNRTLQNKTSLVSGRRVNIVKNYTGETPFYKPDEILDFAAKKGKLYRSDAEDYFVIGNIQNFPWHVIKDVVIGRPAYDNYVVGVACQQNVTVIDATATIKAIHLSGGTKKFAGSNNKDKRYNFRVIGGFPWGIGMTGSMQFASRKKDGKLLIVKRGRKRC